MRVAAPREELCDAGVSKGLSVQWLKSIENASPVLTEINRIKPFPLIRVFQDASAAKCRRICQASIRNSTAEGV
jgi:hypothetical protein